MATRFQQRRGTSSQWAAANPVLADGEMGYEKDTGIVRMGDGVKTWNQLSPILGSQYLPILGKATDSERLDGYDSTAFPKWNDVSQNADAGSLVHRYTDGRIRIGAGVETTDAVRMSQTTSFERDRGSGTTLPTTDLRRGDTYLHTGLNCLMVYRGGTGADLWRQADIPIVTNNTTRSTLISTYGTLMYTGFKIFHAALQVEQIWDKTAQTFRFRLYGSGQVTTDSNGVGTIEHGGGQQPRNHPQITLLFSSTEGINQVLRWMAWSGTSPTVIAFRAYRTDTNQGFPSAGLGLVWNCDF